MINNIVSMVKKSSIYLLMVMVNILLITTIAYFIKITVTPFHLPIIYVLSIIEYCIFYKKEKWQEKLIPVLIGTVIFITSIIISSNVYDTTADGNTYHKLAIGALKNGWNPSYESSRDFTKEKGNVFDVSDDNINALWVDHYAKATEIFASVIYSFTNNIESGKAYTLIFMYITFGIIASYLYKNKKMNWLCAVAISIIIVFNAITVVQICNYYVDAVLMLSLSLILYACFVISTRRGKRNKKRIIFSTCRSHYLVYKRQPVK